jgi:DNA helicase HerA-like ATPase
MDPILLGKGVTDAIAVLLQPRLGNRHGLVAGATGTGRTVTLMPLAEGFSRIGVPVFMADVKGDVAGLAVAGDGSENVLQRAQDIGLTDYAPAPNPVRFWDLYGQLGSGIRNATGACWRRWPSRPRAPSAPASASRSCAASSAASSAANAERGEWILPGLRCTPVFASRPQASAQRP